ncbi:hypothetical protein ACFL1H_06600, partial [Nanoarchaeota archaeon]
MKNQNKILTREDIYLTYKYNIPTKQLNYLNEQKWLPLIQNTKMSENLAYIIGKITGDGHLNRGFSFFFSG